MTDDRAEPTFKAPLWHEAEPPRHFGQHPRRLDMEDAGDIEIAFERPVSHPRPAIFD